MKILAHWNLEEWFLEMAFPARSANLINLRKFPQAPFFRFVSWFNYSLHPKSKKQRSSITSQNTHERLALRPAEGREFRAPVRLRKSPKRRKFLFEPAWFFCYFLGQCQKVSRKKEIQVCLTCHKKDSRISPKGNFYLFEFFFLFCLDTKKKEKRSRQSQPLRGLCQPTRPNDCSPHRKE